MKRLSAETKLAVTKWSVLVGATAVSFPNGLPWYYGNLATYLDSYIRDRTESDNINSQWVMPMFYVFNIVGIGSAQAMGKLLGIKRAIILSAFLLDLSLCLTYFSVGNSFAKTVSLGVVPGLTAGWMLSLNLTYVAMWFGRQGSGVASSIVSCSFGGGALMFNAVITNIVNPENLKPDVNLGTWRYFSQAELLARVPTVCVVLAATSVCIHIPGICLVRNPPVGYEPGKRRPSVRVEAAASRKWSSPKEDAEIESGGAEFPEKKDGNDDVENGVNEQSAWKGEYSDKTSAWKGDYSDRTSLIHRQEEEEEVDETSRLLVAERISDVGRRSDYTPLEVLKTRQFYILWTTVVVMNYGMILETTYYKQFGQLYIDDDDFLTAIGIVVSIFVCIVRIFFGYITDVMDTKNTLILSLSGSSLFLVFWYWTAAIDRWLYMFWTSILGGIQGSMFIIYPMASLKLFGAEYYTTNWALMMSGVAFGNIVFPEVYSALLVSLGWVWLFLFGAFLSLVGMLVTVLFLD